MRILPSVAVGRIDALDNSNMDPNLNRAIQLGRHMADRIEITVAEAQDILTPGGTTEAKSKALQRVIAAVRDCPADVRLETAGAKQLSGNRMIGFEAERVSGSQPRLPELGQVGDRFVDGQTATVSMDGKPLVRVFLSYSQKDEVRARELWQFLQEFAEIDLVYRFDFWDFNDGSILPGVDWHRKTQAAVENGDLGIFAVSRHFLASQYINEHELPDFVARNAAVPVLLEPMKFGKVDLKGLEGKQIFRWRNKAFAENRLKAGREAWAEALRDVLHAILEDRATAQRPVPERTKAARNAQARLRDLEDTPHLTRTYGLPGRLPGADRPPLPAGGSRVDAVQYLVDWSRSDRTPLAAVLGEYGVGKTLTCQALVRELHQRRDQGDTAVPDALYFDLRNLTRLRERAVPTVHEILDECTSRGWGAGDSGRPSAAELLDRAKHNPTLFVIDGLDEALVHLSASDGVVFTRELLSLRPSHDAHSVAGPDTKVLLSCRTHYFRTVSEQYGHFVGQHRDGASADDFEALLLLPFAEEQIREYLERSVPDRDAGQTYEMLASLHDLSDLIQRPITLKLVTQQIEYIEQQRLTGNTVYAADIYRHITADWIERDKGKGKLRAADKVVLATGLAAWMWRERSRTVDLYRIENWLHDEVATNPALRRCAQIDVELLDEELRTATFLVRKDAADGSATEGFRFAHASFQEYFLAQYLLRAIIENHPDDWDLDPSEETLDFLGQLLEKDSHRSDMLAVLGTWRRRYRHGTSELLLRYTLLARQAGWPHPAVSGSDLSGANLRNWWFRGTDHTGLDLSGVILTGADLRNSRWDFVNLRGADLSRTLWQWAVLHRCDMNGSDLSEADLRGAYLHYCAVDNRSILDPEKKGPRVFGSAECERSASNEAIQTTLISQQAHRASIRSALWSVDGNRILTSGSDGTAHVWDARTGETLHASGGPISFGRVVAWSPDETRILTGTDDHSAHVWDAYSGETQQILIGHTSIVTSAAWSSDGSHAVTGSDDHSARVWDTYSGETRQMLVGHISRINAVAWSPDGVRLVTGSSDSTARVWDARTGETLHILCGHDDLVRTVAWSPDGNHILTGSIDGTARIWDARTGETLHTQTGYDEFVRTVAWSPDGNHILTGSTDGTAHIRDAGTGETLHTLTGHINRITTVAWSPDGTHILTGSTDGITHIRDAGTGETLHILLGPTSMVRAVTWSPNGKFILTGSSDSTAHIWNAHTGETLHTLTGHTTSITSVAWSPDGTHVLTGSTDRTARIWNSDTGEIWHTFTGHGGWIRTVAWSPDGTQVLTGSDDNDLRIWDARTGGILHTLTGHTSSITSVAWSPDGTHILTGSTDRTARIWNAHTGETLHALTGHTTSITSVAWSPDGTHILTGSDDGMACVRDAQTSGIHQTLTGHTSSITSVAWSPDGTHILTGSTDRTARIWNAHTGETLHTLTGHTTSITSVAWSPDGTHILTGSTDGTARMWNATTFAEEMRICQFGPSQAAAWRPVDNILTYASEDAWRHLRAGCFDSEGRFVRLEPYEKYYALGHSGTRPSAPTPPRSR
ncbi:WD40 domain-containing protein [Nocardia aurantia]|uniref:Protein TolB n=1 Tax=Nocardia aurantia TaxID=2585199 RepID=A0A7K0DQR9_9NOCA|nr:pentapeptide repeat-containing protein [Nocardia aurantia]MQY28120.1 Protein TolB [Nocardia aurantia]